MRVVRLPRSARSARSAPPGTRVLLPALLLLLLACTSSRTPTAPVQTTTVNVVDFAFSQPAIVVPVGSTVTWTNTGKVAHTSTSTSGLWDSGTLASGASFSHTFPSKGTFAYKCSFHSNMTGTVTVQ